MTYSNPLVLGQTGIPTTVAGHVPTYMEGLAADASGNIYRVHDWDEPHYDVDRVDPATGQRSFTTQQAITDYQLTRVAVETDGTFAYVSGWRGDSTHYTQSIFRINLGAGLQPEARRTDFTSAGHHIEVYTDSAGGSTPALTGLAVQGTDLYVTDSFGGRVLRYHKTTGALQQTYAGYVNARAVCVNPNDNKIWVAHENGKLSSLQDGLRINIAGARIKAISIVGNALAYSSDDPKAPMVVKMVLSTFNITWQYGEPWQAGDFTPNRIRNPKGMVMLPDGSVVLTDSVGPGSRIQKISSAGVFVWQQYCTEKTASACFHSSDPNLIISSTRNFYNAAGAMLAHGRTEGYETNNYFARYDEAAFGPPKMCKFGGNTYFYFFAGDGVAIYNVTSNYRLELVSILGAANPTAQGGITDPPWDNSKKWLWSWNGRGPLVESNCVINGSPTTYLSQDWSMDTQSMSCDDAGNIYAVVVNRYNVPFQGYDGEDTIYKIAPVGTNPPAYYWQNMVPVFANPRLVTELVAKGWIVGTETIHFMQASKADGRLYLLFYVESANPLWINRGGSWMAGNGIIAINTDNSTSFLIRPAQKCVGIAAIPGGGCVTGSNDKYSDGSFLPGSLNHWDDTGAHLQEFTTVPSHGTGNQANGGFDSFSCLSACKSGSTVTIFASDNMNSRIQVYTIT
jgi:hypothetical protein